MHVIYKRRSQIQRFDSGCVTASGLLQSCRRSAAFCGVGAVRSVRRWFGRGWELDRCMRSVCSRYKKRSRTRRGQRLETVYLILAECLVGAFRFLEIFSVLAVEHLNRSGSRRLGNRADQAEFFINGLTGNRYNRRLGDFDHDGGGSFTLIRPRRRCCGRRFGRGQGDGRRGSGARASSSEAS
jgi:hypothetical protein